MKVAVFVVVFSLRANAALALDLTLQSPPGPMSCEEASLDFNGIGFESVGQDNKVYCFDSTFVHVVSNSCKNGCELISLAEADESVLEYRNQGQPGSWVCQSYGGNSRVMFLEHQGVRHKQSFCIKGTDIVSTPYLLNLKNQSNRGE